MGKFQSSKVFDGFSTVFRQWKAETTHCRFVHGYGVSFKVYFEGDLDERNWVWHHPYCIVISKRCPNPFSYGYLLTQFPRNPVGIELAWRRSKSNVYK